MKEPIDRFLLRKAWPEGYLAMRGVQTVGGWLCIRGGETLDVVSFYDGKRVLSMGTFRSDGELVDALEAGELLPLVDPGDPATWACLLVDLARAVSDPSGPLDRLDNLSWVRAEDASERASAFLPDLPRPLPRWALVRHSGKFPGSSRGSMFELEVPAHSKAIWDPALALVLARIYTRENPQ